MASRPLAARIVLTLALVGPLHAQGRWYPPYERGVKAVDAGRWEEAIRLLEQAVTIDARSGPNKYVEGVFRADYYPYAYLAIACQRAGQPDKAQAYLERARRDALPRPLVARLDAVQQELEKLRKTPPAPDKPTEPEKATQTDKPALSAKTVVVDKTGGRGQTGGETPTDTTARAAEASRAAARQAAADAETAFNEGRYADAVARAKESLARDPGNAAVAALQRRAESRVLVEEGRGLANRGSYREAEAKYEVALARDPENADAAFRLRASRAFGDRVRQARAAERRGDLAAARMALDEAARLDPPRFDREGLGRLLETIVAAMGSGRPSGETNASGISSAEADALRQALRAVLRGDGAMAITVLDPVLPPEPAGTAARAAAIHLRAYLAVACATVALSSSDAAESRRMRERASAEFARVLEARPDFALPDRLISPRVIELLRPPRSGR